LGCSSWAESRLQVTLIGVVPCVEKQIAKGARFAPAGNWRHDHRFCNVLALCRLDFSAPFTAGGYAYACLLPSHDEE
jgi:hypothetical protein